MPPVGDLWKITLSYQGTGGLNQNVLHFRGDTIISDGYEQWTTIGQGILMPLWQSVLPTSVNLTGMIVQKMTPTPEDSVIVAPSTAPGTGGLGQENSMLATVISMRTGFASRRKRGRFYLGTIPDGWAEGNSLTATGVAGYNGFVTSLTDNFVGDTAATTFQIGVYSRTVDANNPAPSFEAFTPALAFSFGNVLGSQRRRRQGVGA